MKKKLTYLAIALLLSVSTHNNAMNQAVNQTASAASSEAIGTTAKALQEQSTAEVGLTGTFDDAMTLESSPESLSQSSMEIDDSLLDVMPNNDGALQQDTATDSDYEVLPLQVHQASDLDISEDEEEEQDKVFDASINDYSDESEVDYSTTDDDYDDDSDYYC